MPLRPARTSAALLLLLAAACPVRAAEWSGGGESRGWNDAANWAERRVPVPTIGLTVEFADPQGASFGFGGADPIRFAGLFARTNSGPVILKAPGFVLGGSINSEPEVGFIVEDTAAPARLTADNEGGLTLIGGLRSGWETILTAASNATIVLSGGFDPADFPVTKEGHGSLVFRGGRSELTRFTMRGGFLELDGADVAVPFSEIGSASTVGSPGISLRNRATLRLRTSDSVFRWRRRLELGAPGAAADASTLDAGGRELRFNSEPAFASGACITNAGLLRFPYGGVPGKPATVRIPPGFRLYCEGVSLGGNPGLNWQTDRNGLGWIDLVVEGPDVPDGPGNHKLSGPPTVLQFPKGGLWIGGRPDGVLCSNATATLSGAVVLTAPDQIYVPGSPARGNRLRLLRGVRADVLGIDVGRGSVSNSAALSGARVTLGKEGLHVGCGAENGAAPTANRVLVRDGARVLSDGPLEIGWGRRNRDKAKLAPFGNELQVLAGSRLETAGAKIGVGASENPTRDNSVAVTGAGAVWNLRDGELAVGVSDSGVCTNSLLLVRSGGLVTNAHDVVVGRARNDNAFGNRIVVLGGRLCSTGTVRVGTTTGSSNKAGAFGNSIVVAGQGRDNGVWDFGGGTLVVGGGRGWAQDSKRNFLEVRPGGRLRAIGSLVLGESDDGANNNLNVFALAGGVVEPVGSLRVRAKNTISVTINAKLPRGANPLYVTGDVAFEENSWILPVGSPATPKGVYPALTWKGEAKGLENLRLSPDADDSRWDLVVDAEHRQVGIRRR